RLVAARLLTGLALALLASATALATLAVRTGIDHPTRAIAGTLMFAVIYLAVGAVVGSFVHNPVNGTVIVLFVWDPRRVLRPRHGHRRPAGDPRAAHPLRHP